MMHYYRACPKHRDELVETEAMGHERMWCPQGHFSESWLIVSDAGSSIGQAWADRPAMVVAEPIEVAPPKKKYTLPKGRPPFRPCVHGHTDWEKLSNGRWICQTCRKETWTRQNRRRSEEKKEIA